MKYVASVTAQPAAEPVSLTEAKTYLRVDGSAEDSLITSLLLTARTEVEQICRRKLITQTVRCDIREWEQEIQLPFPPLASVTTVKYYDGSNVLQTLSSSYYVVETLSDVGMISLAYGYTWPTVYERPYPIQITYQAGYGSGATHVPEPLRQAILIATAEMYEHREENEESRFTELKTFQRLMAPYRVYLP